jgi:ligand-binding sensor domain-containing protein
MIRNLVTWIFFTVTPTWTGICVAQSLQPVVHTITSKDGLPSDNVYSIFQDSKGMMWFCTERGLVRYDGCNMKTYSQSAGLPDNEVLEVFEVKPGELWVNTFNRYAAIKQKDRFLNLKNHPVWDSIFWRTSTVGVGQALFTDSKQWVSVLEGLYVFDGKVLTSIEVPIKGDGVYRMEDIGEYVRCYCIMSIFKIRKKDYWCQVEADFSKQFSKFDRVLDSDNKGNFTLVSFKSDSVIVVKREGATFRVLPHVLPQTGTLYIDAQNRYWVCSLRKGAYCYRLNEREEFVLEKVIFPDIRINKMIQDREGTFWIGTKGLGILAFREDFAGYPQGFYSDKEDNSYRTYVSSGQVLAGNSDGQVFSLTHERVEFKYTLPERAKSQNIRQVYKDKSGQEWVITDDALYWVSEKNVKQIKGVLSPKMLSDDNQFLYIASGGTLYSVDKSTLNSENKVKQRLVSIYVDHQNVVWGGALNGLLTFRDLALHRWSDQFPTLASRTMSIQEHQGVLWVVNAGFGVVKVEKDLGIVRSAVPLLNSDGKPFQEVLPNVVFEDDCIVFATSKAIYQVFHNGRVVKINMKTELTTSEITSIARCAKNKIWVATTRGILLKDISLNLSGDPEYPVFISDIKYRLADVPEKVDLLEQDSMTAVWLPATASLVEVSFANLSNNFGEEVQYECQIVKGISSASLLTWSNLWNGLVHYFLGKKETIVLNQSSFSLGVDPEAGKYNITAYALYPGYPRSQNSDTVELVIRPQLYEILWVQLLFLFLALFGLYLFYQSRLSMQETRNKMLLLSFQTLQSQINPHFVGNSVNVFNQFFYPPDPAKASNYIQLFNSILRRTFELSDSTFTPFEEELKYINNYLTMMKIRLGDKLTFHISVDKSISASMPFPVLILQPILENATIHGINPGGVTHIQVLFAEVDGYIHCVVEDNGIGLNASLERRKESGRNKKSVGLNIIRSKAQILNTLHNLDMQFEMKDIGDPTTHKTGTRAVILFKKR